ncbi:hypothetical protein [Winogradskya humida]|uniref:Tetratricopeptide repeat protein n=1 Tax=Winogradskya humida TaxID=113566 RepID=A0ABQ3ZPC3_9ACTN|nr:hypothetical protein [Actinoplanes humidus]GIE20017.1 hypothetical protein Ahu01nite_031190 [Actinoplanes humidus]
MTADTLERLTEAVKAGRAGAKGPARAALQELWTEVGAAGDPLHRASIAHYLADLQESVADELMWDQRALAAVADLGDERAHAFLPSLHLNLADAHRRLGERAPAEQHLAEAASLAGTLSGDEYGALIRTGIDNVGKLLAVGSTAPL